MFVETKRRRQNVHQVKTKMIQATGGGHVERTEAERNSTRTEAGRLMPLACP
jgi:hypothetical protein